MFAKVLIVCAVAVAALAAELPAGIHPAVCPNYPFCDMEVLARHTPEGLPIPEWEPPSARMMPAALSIVARPTGFQYPAGVDPVACPNYPYCK